MVIANKHFSYIVLLYSCFIDFVDALPLTIGRGVGGSSYYTMFGITHKCKDFDEIN